MWATAKHAWHRRGRRLDSFVAYSVGVHGLDSLPSQAQPHEALEMRRAERSVSWLAGRPVKQPATRSAMAEQPKVPPGSVSACVLIHPQDPTISWKQDGRKGERNWRARERGSLLAVDQVGVLGGSVDKGEATTISRPLYHRRRPLCCRRHEPREIVFFCYRRRQTLSAKANTVTWFFYRHERNNT